MPNEQQLAAATIELLKRVQLQGAEVDSYLMIRDWLMGIVKVQSTEVRNEETGAGGAGDGGV